MAECTNDALCLRKPSEFFRTFYEFIAASRNVRVQPREAAPISRFCRTFRTPTRQFFSPLLCPQNIPLPVFSLQIKYGGVQETHHNNSGSSPECLDDVLLNNDEVQARYMSGRSDNSIGRPTRSPPSRILCVWHQRIGIGPYDISTCPHKYSTPSFC